jgi:methionyl-tRNA synthetase
LDIGDLMKDLKFFEALQRVKEKIDWGNKYIDETKLWELVKADKNKAQKVLRELLAVIVKVGESLAPFIPETSQKILQASRAKKITKGEALFPRF